LPPPKPLAEPMRICAMLLIAVSAATGQPFNGFDVSNAAIPLDEILGGGPLRDGIPSIDHPRFIAPSDAGFMKGGDEVVSVTLGTETRAYPLRILVWHEIVNDELAGQPIAVTYCPLCGTAMVFSRLIGGRMLDFGVSGLLYQSDVLMYDRQTDSLWSQLAMRAVSGPLVNTELPWLASQQLTWAAWKEEYPQGKVLSMQTGSARNYSGNAYARYHQSPDTMFPVPSRRTELPQKDWVFGVLADSAPHAYSVRALAEQHTINDSALEITYNPDSQRVRASNRATGEELPVVKVYWFAWQAFYPNTELVQ